jgi:hypothetical protein
MKNPILLVVFIAFIVMAAISLRDNSAMSACQEKHSYDTCFQLLNR